MNAHLFTAEEILYVFLRRLRRQVSQEGLLEVVELGTRTLSHVFLRHGTPQRKHVGAVEQANAPKEPHNERTMRGGAAQ